MRSSLPEKLIAQVAFKAGGDVFHHLLAINPKHLAIATPLTIQACDLQHGDYGVNGSVVQWRYILDDKPQIAKQVLQLIDKEKKQISWKTIEGDLLELYKKLTTTAHIETKHGIDFVTWTIDYELIDADKPHPVHVLNLLIQFTSELEAHIFGKEMKPSKTLRNGGETLKEEGTEEILKVEETSSREKKTKKEKPLFQWGLSRKITLSTVLIMFVLKTFHR